MKNNISLCLYTLHKKITTLQWRSCRKLWCRAEDNKENVTKLEGAKPKDIQFESWELPEKKKSRKLVEKEKLGKAITSMNTAVSKSSLLRFASSLDDSSYIALFTKHLCNFINWSPIPLCSSKSTTLAFCAIKVIELSMEQISSNGLQISHKIIFCIKFFIEVYHMIKMFMSMKHHCAAIHINWRQTWARSWTFASLRPS